MVPELRALVEFRRLNFMDADFGLTEPPEIIFCRNVIIYFDRPTQVRLLQKLTPPARAGRVFLCGPFRVPSRDGFAADSGCARRLQEARMIETLPVLPDLNLQPGELYLARSPGHSANDSRILCRGDVLERSGWASARCATACCPGARRAGLPGSTLSEGYRYVDFSIRYLAQQFDALGAHAGDELEVKAVRRRGRASDDR